jgi:Family of unknown function (DUF5946)
MPRGCEERSACIGCGVPAIDGPTHRYMESSPGCWHAYGEVLAQEYSDEAFRAAHRLTSDTCAVQHPGRPSPQSIRSSPRGEHITIRFGGGHPECDCPTNVKLQIRPVSIMPAARLSPGRQHFGARPLPSTSRSTLASGSRGARPRRAREIYAPDRRRSSAAQRCRPRVR